MRFKEGRCQVVCSGPAGTAQPGYKPHGSGKLPKSRMKTVLAFFISIALKHHRFHVVIEHLSGHPLKTPECSSMARFRRVITHVAAQLHEQETTLAQYGHKTMQRRPASPHLPPVYLHLQARLRFKPDNRFWRLP